MTSHYHISQNLHRTVQYSYDLIILANNENIIMSGQVFIILLRFCKLMWLLLCYINSIQCNILILSRTNCLIKTCSMALEQRGNQLGVDWKQYDIFTMFFFVSVKCVGRHIFLNVKSQAYCFALLPVCILQLHIYVFTVQ